MKKNIPFILILFILLASCKTNKLKNTHGLAYLEKREKLLYISKSNKNDTIKILGQPATKGMNNQNVWIYIERTITKGGLLKFGRNYLSKNNVLVLEFKSNGILVKKNFYDKDDMNKMTFAKAITENEIRKENFIVGFLSSVRQKAESSKK